MDGNHFRCSDLPQQQQQQLSMLALTTQRQHGNQHNTCYHIFLIPYSTLCNISPSPRLGRHGRRGTRRPVSATAASRTASFNYLIDPPQYKEWVPDDKDEKRMSETKRAEIPCSSETPRQTRAVSKNSHLS
jgi:hypothetical protein